MKCAWAKMKMVVGLLLVMVWPLTGTASENRWQGFYTRVALDTRLARPLLTLAPLHEDIPRVLTAEDADGWPMFASNFPAKTPRLR